MNRRHIKIFIAISVEPNHKSYMKIWNGLAQTGCDEVRQDVGILCLE